MGIEDYIASINDVEQQLMDKIDKLQVERDGYKRMLNNIKQLCLESGMMFSGWREAIIKEVDKALNKVKDK